MYIVLVLTLNSDNNEESGSKKEEIDVEEKVEDEKEDLKIDIDKKEKIKKNNDKKEKKKEPKEKSSSASKKKKEGVVYFSNANKDSKVAFSLVVDDYTGCEYIIYREKEKFNNGAGITIRTDSEGKPICNKENIAK